MCYNSSNKVLINSIRLSRSNITIEAGEEFSNLSVSISSANATDKFLSWRSNNPAVASVRNKIEITSYDFNGKTYSGTMKITYYDHFGLDIKDMNGYGGLKEIAIDLLDGFSSWFILQHCKELTFSVQPKPFVTVIEIGVSFIGEI